MRTQNPNPKKNAGTRGGNGSNTFGGRNCHDSLFNNPPRSRTEVKNKQNTYLGKDKNLDPYNFDLSS